MDNPHFFSETMLLYFKEEAKPWHMLSTSTGGAPNIVIMGSKCICLPCVEMVLHWIIYNTERGWNHK